jgi:hypothetical protein
MDDDSCTTQFFALFDLNPSAIGDGNIGSNREAYTLSGLLLIGTMSSA